MKIEKKYQKQINHTICSTNGKAGIVDNRLHTTASKSVAQMIDIINEKEQVFNNKSTHISQGQTNPYHLVNTLNRGRYNTLIQDESGTIFHNAHMMAATFGGSNGIENIVAWSEDMEENWSDAENDIRGTNPAKLGKPSKNEKGNVKTVVSIPADNEQYSSIIRDSMNIAKPMLINPINWEQVEPDVGQLTESRLRGAYNDGDMLERLKISMANDVKPAFDKMPIWAHISYKSTSPSTKREYTWRFNDNIVHPIINRAVPPMAICRLISPIKIDGWVLK